MTPSLWSTHDLPLHPPLDQDVDVDVAIVGGGITGVTAALHLATQGRRVALLEGNRLCSGVTRRTTGHVTVVVDPRYQKIAKTFGAEGARLVAASSFEALAFIAEQVARHAINCDLRRIAGYLYAESAEQRAELEGELAASFAAGIDVNFDGAPLPFSVEGALRYPDQLRIDAVRYVGGMVRAAIDLGARIFENTRITDIVDGAPAVLTTDKGITIRAAAAIHATHVPLNRFALLGKVAHYQSYALAFENTSITDALFWDMSDPYHYTRIAESMGKRYVIIGGEDHRTGEDKHTEAHFESLLGYARDRWGVTTPAFRWSSQVIEPMDGLPFIGLNSGAKHVYVATGFSGNGITYGTIAALVLADLIAGVETPYAELFSPGRFKLSQLGTFIGNNAHDPVHAIIDRLAPGDVNGSADVARGQGCIVRAHGKQLAVYRDESDRLHAVSALCTHLGCVVKFNDAERTWDCPCHGSRFSVDGEVIEGPATTPLAGQPVDLARTRQASSR